MGSEYTLGTVPIGAVVRMLRPGLAASACRRLAEIGLRPGSVVRVLHRTAGGGRIVATGDSRIALDRETVAACPVCEAPLS